MSDELPEVDVHDAIERIEEGAVLVDVREDEEWAAGHAPQAMHLPLSRLGAEYADSLPRDRPLLAVCKIGGRSAQATMALRQAGYDVTNVYGGMKAWEEAGLPVVDEAGRTGTVV